MNIDMLIQELNGVKLDIDVDYRIASDYYDSNLKNFYLSNLYRAGNHFNEYAQVKYVIDTTNWERFLTDKFTSFQTPVDGHACKDITDTFYVKDTYYDLANIVYKYRDIAEQNKATVKSWLIKNNRYQIKPFYMMYIVGAFVEHRNNNKKNFMENIRAFKKINWIELEQ